MRNCRIIALRGDDNERAMENLDAARKMTQAESGPEEWIWDTGSGNHLISPSELARRYACR